jgi:hypothetical protein
LPFILNARKGLCCIDLVIRSSLSIFDAHI